MNLIIKLNGVQHHMQNKVFTTTSKMLVHDVLNILNIYGEGELPTKDKILSSIDGDSFEIGSSSYTMSIEVDK